LQLFSSRNTEIDKVFQINHPDIDTAGVNLFVKRIDQPDPILNGNKSFKLKYNLLEAINQNLNTVLTFGGAYSNHIVATAAACNKNNLQSIGIIRGEEKKDLNPSLKYAHEKGMKLHFVSREEYRRKDNIEYIQSLKMKFDSCFIVPEGGANKLGVKGCSEILSLEDKKFNCIVTACGTATTLAGITNSLINEQKSIGIAVLKAENYLNENCIGFTEKEKQNKYSIINDYHFGGYAKQSVELEEFVKKFNNETNIEIEPIYTGKLFYAIMDLIKKKHFKQNENILAIHTGGLQYLKLK